MMRGIRNLCILIYICCNIDLTSTQDYNFSNYNTYEEYEENVNDHDCGRTEHFCPSTGSCVHESEPCDGKCLEEYIFCSSTNSCISIHEYTSCDGNCSKYGHFCAFFDSCIPQWYACDGNCPEDYPNLCDNGTVCYANSEINDGNYDCEDRSDENQSTGDPCRELYRYCSSNGKCLNESEPCDGECREHYHFSPSSNMCIYCNSWEYFCVATDSCQNNSRTCDGQCGGRYHFCPSTESCIPKARACDGNCADDWPNLCDNGKRCYPVSSINDRYYDCKDKSDEYRPTGEPCRGFYRFCPSNGSCLHDSEPCDGQCGVSYHFCSSKNSCLHESEACDGECGLGYHFCSSNNLCVRGSEPCDGQHCGRFDHFCPSTNTCINEDIACDGKCPDEFPNLCDNGTRCYPNSDINDRKYHCKDRSDEHHPTEEAQLPDNYTYSVDKFLQLKTLEDKFGLPVVDCEDGTVHAYRYWCKEQHSRICGGVSTIDYFLCHNSSLWEDHPCGESLWINPSNNKIIERWERGCKIPGKCINSDDKCDIAIDTVLACGSSDYSDEMCPVNEKTLRKHTRYFRCQDNSSLIHPTLVCDGFIHCGDSSDENECDNCPRVNNIEVHNQVVQLKTEEIRDLVHLKITAIMKCKSPYGQTVCATPGDGIPECALELKEGVWQTQDEVELTSSELWKTIFEYMSYIFLISVVVLFKTTQISYLCNKSTEDVPILISYNRTITLDSDPLPLFTFKRSCTSTNSFLTPLFTTTDPMQLTRQFRKYYIQNHKLERFEEFFNFCLNLSQFLTTRMERDIFLCEIYALEAQIHGMSPTCTDRCLKQQSSGALEPLFDAVYGSISDKFPSGVKNAIFTKDKLLCLYYLLRIKTFLFRYFFFYYDIVQEYVLLSFILGTIGHGISTTTWLNISDFDYTTIIVYMYAISVFIPLILFSLQLAFSSKIGIIFGVKNPSVRQKIFFGMYCFIFFPFIPTVLFFRIEKLQMKMFNLSNRTSKVLNQQTNQNGKLLFLENEIVEASKILNYTNSDITETKSFYKQFREWELAIEMPIQSTLTIIFSFMKKSTTVVNQVFQNWFISDTKSLILLIGMSLRSIIAMQISNESARRNNFLGSKSKIFLAPLYIFTSIPRIASIVIFAAVPLGLMDLLGHWTVEKQGNRYYSLQFTDTLFQLTDCTKKSAYNGTFNFNFFNSTVFSANTLPTKYTAWDTPTYMAILMAVLATSVIINFIWLCFRNRKSLIEKIILSSKSALCITIESDFDEDDENVNPSLCYKEKFSTVHKEYILKLLLHTATNMVLTFPWALAFQVVNERHQLLTEIGNCLGVKGTVEMEDISLERLWWGQWVLPLVMAVLGVINYGWFRLYVKYGHPWRRLLISDDERIEEWKTLKLWEILENQNNN